MFSIRAPDPARGAPSGSAGRILAPGRNCWRVEPARRVAFARDGEAYFRAAAEAMALARRSILLLAWDVDSETEINRHGIDGLPAALGPFLDALARRRAGLQVRILSWDFASVFALEREKLPTVKLDWSTHERVHLFLDDRHPTSASHHQKVLVIDDSVAFVGGLDMTRQRWDTPEHVPDDPRRKDHARPDGYAPFHDVQACVDGRCARALAALARERWRVAVGERLPALMTGRDAWPASLKPVLLGAGVGIARTIPAMSDQAEVREAERLFADEIAAARRTLYVENQYFTSQSVADALEASLRRAEGPEIVIVLPKTSSGWLEEATMGQLRSRAITRLREADSQGRLRIVHPGGPARGETRINVHAKVLIADDVHVRVGSANMSNRSMSLDTECDLAIDAASDAHREGIARFRAELLGEHLGMPPEEVQSTIAACGGSLVRLVDETSGADRSLQPLHVDEPPWLGLLEPAIELIDPARPPRSGPPPRRRRTRRLSGLAAGLLVLALLTILWTATPLREHLRPESLARLADGVQDSPLAMLAVIAGHAIAGLLAIPVTLLILATMIAFGPYWGAVLAFAGCLANAAAGYGAGRVMGGAAEGLLRDHFDGATALLRTHGTLSVAIVRLVPIAPYSLVNVAAGAMRLPFRDYMAGTMLGVLPWIAGLAALGKGLRVAIEHPGPRTFAVVGALVIAGVAASIALRRRARASSEAPAP